MPSNRGLPVLECGKKKVVQISYFGCFIEYKVENRHVEMDKL